MQGYCALATHTALIIAYFLIGILYGVTACKWSTITSLYYATLTISTVGYGDYSAMNCDGDSGNKLPHQIFMLFYILFGLNRYKCRERYLFIPAHHEARRTVRRRS